MQMPAVCRKISLFLLFATAVVSLQIPSRAQKKKNTPPPQPAVEQQQTAFPIETLKVEGSKQFAAAKIIEVSGLKIGQVVEKADFEKARQRLLATGAFESVGYEFKPSPTKTGFNATLQVMELTPLYAYRFEDLPVPEEKLRAALRQLYPILIDQLPATKEILDRYTAAVQSLTGEGVKIEGKLSTEGGVTTILFRPDVPRPQVAEIHFAGSSVIAAGPLQRALSDVAIGTAYSETSLRMMLDASVRPLYDARGRIRVAFPKIETSPAKEYDGVVVTVTVDEGPSYSLGEINFAGVSRDDAAAMRRIANIQPNDVANFDDIKAALDRIYAKFREKGYLRVSGRADRDIDDKEHRVSVTLAIDPGALFVMGKLELIGLDLMTEPAIHKMWRIKEGDPFDPEYPDLLLKEVREQGVFDNLGKTTSEVNIDEKTHTVGVKLYFKGAGPPVEKKRGGRGGFGNEK